MAHSRFRALRGAAVLVTLAAAAPSCSDSSSNDGAVPLDAVPDKLAAALCDVVAQCFGPATPLALSGNDCKTRQVAEIKEGQYSLFQSAIDHGTLHYDGSKVDGCAEAIRTAGCDAFVTRLSTLCKGVVSGTVEDGDDCSFSAECADGLFCKTDAACPGKCTPLLSAGQACDDADHCVDGLICSDSTHKCVAPAGDGEACEGTSDPPCPPASWCVGGSATTAGTCKKATEVFAAADGATCDPNAGALCTEGLRCALIGAENNKPKWQCEKPSSGSTCHVGFPESCADGSFCEISGTSVEGSCKSLPGDGEPCASHIPADPNSDHDLCAVGTVCDQATCHKVVHLGIQCNIDDECFSGICKDGSCAPAHCEP